MKNYTNTLLVAGVIGLVLLGLAKTGIITINLPHGKVAQNAAPAAVSAEDDPMPKSIRARAEKLAGSNRMTERMKEKSLEVRGDIKKGDFKAADKIITDVFKKTKMGLWYFSPYMELIPDIGDANDPDYEAKLMTWQEQDPKNATPHLLHAIYLAEVGWAKRGNHTINKTQEESMRVFSAYLAKADDEINTAIKLDPENPGSYYIKLDNLAGSEGNSPATEAAFQEGIAKFPNFYSLYSRRLSSLVPKWGGSVQDMHLFTRKYAGNAAAYSSLKLLYLELYTNLADAAGFNCSDVDGKKAWQGCFVAVMQQIITPEVKSGIKAGLELYGHVDEAQYNDAVYSQLADVLPWVSYDRDAAGIIQQAAEVTNSDNQMNETDPGHNDFIMDLLTADGWELTGNYNNALIKDKEALHDLERAPFPTESKKAQNIAHILVLAGNNYSRLSQFEDALVYYTAAEMIEPGSSLPHTICYNYFKLGHFAVAVKECTKAIQETDSIESRLWRGYSYKAIGDIKAAMADFLAVSDSDWSVRESRASAAYEYLALNAMTAKPGKDDERAAKVALDFLEKHAYLFDELGETEKHVSIAYNDRCYAYMHLRQYQQALDDCNKSLTFFNLPDAVVKRRQLLKLLATPEKGL